MSHFHTAIGLNSNDFGALTQLGILKRRESKLGVAKKLLTQATKINPESGEAWYELAQTYTDLADF